MAGYTQRVNGSFWSDLEEVNGIRQATVGEVNTTDTQLCRDLIEHTGAPEQGCYYVFDFSKSTLFGSTVTFCPLLIPYDNDTTNPIKSGFLNFSEFMNGNTQIRPMFRSNYAVNYKYNTNLTNGLGNVERTLAICRISAVTPTGLRNPTGSTLTDATVDVSRSTAFVDVPPQFIVAQGFPATSTTYSGPEITLFSTQNTFTWTDGETYSSKTIPALRYTANNQRFIIGNSPVHSQYQNNFILEGGPEGNADGTTNNLNVSGAEPSRVDLSLKATGDLPLWLYRQNTSHTVRVVFVNTTSSGSRNFGNYGGERGWRIRMNANRFEVIFLEGLTTSTANGVTRTRQLGLTSSSLYAGDNQWNLLHFTIDDSEPTVFRMYLNGGLLGSTSAGTGDTFAPWRGSTDRSLTPYTAQWGNRFSGEGWRGWLNEMSEYDHAFSTTEISNDFAYFKAKYWEED
jgi:hypothetical protein